MKLSYLIKRICMIFFLYSFFGVMFSKERVSRRERSANLSKISRRRTRLERKQRRREKIKQIIKEKGLTKGLSAIHFVPKSSSFLFNIFCLSRAKWLSYEGEIPILYDSFNGSDMLMFSQFEKEWQKDINSIFLTTFCYGWYFHVEKMTSCLYNWMGMCPYIKVNWDDEGFLDYLRIALAPRFEIEEPFLQENRINVAIESMRCGDYRSDKTVLDEYYDYGYKTFFPEDVFYISKLKSLSHMLNDVPLHVCIFTDISDETRILKKYRDELFNLDINFSCICRNDLPDSVLKTLFQIAQYDCLIRGNSIFSFLSEKIGKFFIAISPEVSYWKEGKLEVNKEKIILNMKYANKVEDFLDISLFKGYFFKSYENGCYYINF